VSAPLPLDEPRLARPGEEVDPVALGAFLRAHGLGGASLDVLQFPGGFSNLTYLVRTEGNEYVLRRAPRGVATGSAHDMLREARILTALGGRYPLAPRVLAVEEDASILGAPFYLMQRVSGVILRDRLPRGVFIGPDVLRALSESFVEALVDMHALDVHAAGLATLGHPEGYVARQVSGWTRRYEASRTGEQPAVEASARWLATQLPAERGVALVHNDFKYDNLVLDPADLSCIRAVLDWEMATIGDPLMDLGTSLAYWVDPDDPPGIQAIGVGLTALPGNLRRMQIVERYSARSGIDPGNAVYYYVFGLFKVAVIAQQIFARHVRGLTADPRFARLDRAVSALGALAMRAIELQRIERLG
jgi:aminoglycoside phosphotransferase (APT) family kinase protein